VTAETRLEQLPHGTVTFLFTDIEGSTRLLQVAGRERYGQMLREHARLLREAIESSGGRVVDTQGDAFFAVFPRARAAVDAALAAQAAIAAKDWPDDAVPRVRIGLHTGEAELDGGRYVGLAVHKAERICSAADGGQIMLSTTTRDVVEDGLPDGTVVRDAGRRPLKGLARPEHVWELVPGQEDGRLRALPATRREGGLSVRRNVGVVLAGVFVGVPVIAVLATRGAVGVVAAAIVIIVALWAVAARR
jgi:class 3 adenylate cyclase